MRKIYFKLLRFFNNHLPSKMEARYALEKHGDKMTLNINSVTRLYSEGMTLEQIGENMYFTRERARQMLMKGCRYIK